VTHDTLVESDLSGGPHWPGALGQAGDRTKISKFQRTSGPEPSGPASHARGHSRAAGQRPSSRRRSALRRCYTEGPPQPLAGLAYEHRTTPERPSRAGASRLTRPPGNSRFISPGVSRPQPASEPLSRLTAGTSAHSPSGAVRNCTRWHYGAYSVWHQSDVTPRDMTCVETRGNSTGRAPGVCGVAARREWKGLTNLGEGDWRKCVWLYIA